MANNEWGMIGKALRAMGKSRERLGAKAVKEEMMEAKKDNEDYESVRQRKIDADIRARRNARRDKG